jgi:non-specific serine/threonine protein kinase
MFDEGLTTRVHHQRCVLDRQGTLRLGHPTSVAISFAIEIRSAAGGRWASPVRRAANTIRRDGDYWTLECGGRSLQLKDSRGLRYLAELLLHPRRELHALDLVMLGRREMVPGDPTAGPGLGPPLDARARAEYRHRLRDLRQELADADATHDLGRTARLRAEIDLLARELARAIGLGGRDREPESDAERARVASPSASGTRSSRFDATTRRSGITSPPPCGPDGSAATSPMARSR